MNLVLSCDVQFACALSQERQNAISCASELGGNPVRIAVEPSKIAEVSSVFTRQAGLKMVAAGVLLGIYTVQVVAQASDVLHPLDCFPLKQVGTFVSHSRVVGGTEEIDAGIPNACADYPR